MTVTESPAVVHSPGAPPPDGPLCKGRAIVIGASSGIGAALVRRLVADGYRVAALARRGERLAELEQELGEAALTRVHDVTDRQVVPVLFEDLVRGLGGLDLLVYAAGIMPKVGPQEYDTEKDVAILETNLCGMIAWGNEAARLFGSQRRGTICGISSIAGVRGRRGQPVYGTSKAAMDHYLEALRNRLDEYGVHVVTIRPGFVETEMTAGLGLRGAISADQAARGIQRAIERHATVRYLPRRWWLVAQIVRSIPSFFFRRMSI